MPQVSPTAARSTKYLTTGWLFHLGDIAAPLPNTHIGAYMANKAGWARGAARPTFDDSDWRSLDVPHDWSIEGEYSPDNHQNRGFLPRGIGWYRRHFRLDELSKGRRFTLYFDGVSSHCQVFVNGHLLHRNHCGYTPFHVDFTDVATFGDALNTVVLRVDATPVEGWWYEGAGIYRPVQLIETDPVHVTSFGVFVNPIKKSTDTWETRVETTVRNATAVDQTISVVTSIAETGGKVRADFTIVRGETKTIRQSIDVTSPKLWSTDTPAMHRVVTSVHVDGVVVDTTETPFGYRTIRFDPKDGFFLNDRKTFLKGVCIHQDHAGVGVAVPESIERFRIRQIKAMGCNAVRCAHNPPSATFLRACDELGLLVMDENRTFGSSPEHLTQLSAMVLRDRNHPSVILWSLCNEESIQGNEVAANIAQTMADTVKSLDLSRSTTVAISGGMFNLRNVADPADVVGVNYQLDSYPKLPVRYPDKSILASETHCAYGTRGVYRSDPEKFYFADNDTEHAPWGATARKTWRAIRENPHVAGIFIWAGIDYRGEPSPYAWPCVTSHWGLMDLCGFPKEGFFLHKAWFSDEPMVHIAAHWTQPQSESVRVYSNCDEVELFLNDRSLGRQKVDPIEMNTWTVTYEPGELKAKGYRGANVVADSCLTANQANHLSLFPDSSEPLLADGRSALTITVFACDDNARMVPTANHEIRFEVRGPAKIIGVGNGDPTSHEPDRASKRRLFNGLAQVILQTTREPGEIELIATADGLESPRRTFHSEPYVVHDEVPIVRRSHFVTGWRMSAITATAPDPHAIIADSDMNTFERVEPSPTGQSAWTDKTGYARYVAKIKAPKALIATGGRVVFHGVAGDSQIYLDGAGVSGSKIAFAAGRSEMAISVILHANSTPAGLTAPVELLPPE